MRLRVAASSSSASSSSRAVSRWRSVVSGSAMRASARASRSAASGRPGPGGYRSHSSAFLGTVALARDPRQHLPPGEAQKCFRRVGPAGIEAAQLRVLGGGLRLVVRQPGRPAKRRQGAGGLQRRFQRRLQIGQPGDEILNPAAQAPGARAAAFSAEQPAPQLGRLNAREFRRERAIRRIEQVVALVEHVAGRHARVVEPAPYRLRHDQRMVCDHEIGSTGAADRALDKAPLPMRTGGVDAFAAPVREREEGGRPEQLREPARQVAALQIAVIRRQRPARDQPENDGERRRRPGERRTRQIFEVQQAKVVFPSLAYDYAPPTLLLAREQAGQLAVDLAL